MKMEMKHINAEFLIAMANGKQIEARYAYLDVADESDVWFDINNEEEISFNAAEQLILGFAKEKNIALEFRIRRNDEDHA